MRLSSLVIALTEVYVLLMIIRVLLSWVPLPRSVDFLEPALDFIDRVTNPVLDLARRVIPPIGGLDFSPILAFYIVNLVGRWLASTLLYMGL